MIKFDHARFIAYSFEDVRFWLKSKTPTPQYCCLSMASTCKIQFKGEFVTCRVGDNLRNVLLNAKLSPHNGQASWLNCRGLGTCGTCAVLVEGPVSAQTKVERMRLNFPPHKEGRGLRLACQCSVEGDIRVEKLPGFWGAIRD